MAKTKRCKQCKAKHEEREQGGFDMYSPPSALGFYCTDTNCMAETVD